MSARVQDADTSILPVELSASPLPPSSPEIHTPAWVGWVVVVLLLSYAAMSFIGTLRKGVSFDEGLQLAAGYNIWLNNDLRIEGANGDFIKRWATLPYLISRPKFTSHDDRVWQRSMAYELGDQFLFGLGNDAESLLRQGRAMVVLLGVATGLLIFWCARDLFGYVGGLVALTIFAFSPSMLAFGAIVSTDMSITLLLSAATVCIWRLLHAITMPRLLASLACFGLLVLAKPSALVILPITAVLIVIRFAGGRPLTVQWRDLRRTIVDRRALVIIFAGCILLHAFAGWSAIWAHYGFRYSASPNPADPKLELYRVPVRDSVSPILATTIAWMRQTHAFPQGFRHGVDALLANDDEMGSYMDSHWKIGGQLMFFPYALWVKTPPTLWIAILLGLGAGWLVRSPARAAPADTGTGRATSCPSLYALSPYLTLVACYLFLAMMDDLNIGHRHILPIYPALDVLAGGAALAWTANSRAWRAALSALLMTAAADSLLIHPNYLAYFSPQSGGPRSGYKHLVDSSLDWGMELPGLKAWIERHDPQQTRPFFLAYFGNDNPHHYGIKARLLPGYFDRRPVEGYGFMPGYYAISASLLQGVYTAAFGRWSRAYETRYQRALSNIRRLEQVESDPVARAALVAQAGPAFWRRELDLYDNLRFARLCAWLRHQGEPPHHVAHSLFIWHLDFRSLDAALNGPPAELTDDPPIVRRFR